MISSRSEIPILNTLYECTVQSTGLTFIDTNIAKYSKKYTTIDSLMPRKSLNTVIPKNRIYNQEMKNQRSQCNGKVLENSYKIECGEVLIVFEKEKKKLQMNQKLLQHVQYSTLISGLLNI